LTNDPEGLKTFGEALVGWDTDAKVLAALKANGADFKTFQDGLATVNNFANFPTEDSFAHYIETTMVLQKVSPRTYGYSNTAGAGLHNWLHGQLEDTTSPIDVGNPRSNLHNLLFWRLHGKKFFCFFLFFFIVCFRMD
jgi:hypothetical protein